MYHRVQEPSEARRGQLIHPLVTGICELPSMDARNQTQDLCKSSHMLLTMELSFQPQYTAFMRPKMAKPGASTHCMDTVENKYRNK